LHYTCLGLDVIISFLDGFLVVVKEPHPSHLLDRRDAEAKDASTPMDPPQFGASRLWISGAVRVLAGIGDILARNDRLAVFPGHSVLAQTPLFFQRLADGLPECF
jgi:hypothetical protein